MVNVVFVGLSLVGIFSLAATYLIELTDIRATRYNRVKGALASVVCIGLGILLTWGLFTQPLGQEAIVVSKPATPLTVVANR